MNSPRQRHPDPERTEQLEAILREGPWVRRLARGLLGDEAAADDLSQDVLTVALSQRPNIEASGLRAWLRTVARRLAARQRERDSLRARVEKQVARPEAIEAVARKNLSLHRRLSAALDQLDPPYRTALILRYLEGLPPRRIAERLDIPVTAARKRVSRGLAKLRTRLDEEEGGVRENWVRAVAPLLHPMGSPPSGFVPIGSPPPGAPALGAPASGWMLLFMIMTPKILLFVFALAAAIGLVLLVDPFGGASPEQSQASASVEDAALLIGSDLNSASDIKPSSQVPGSDTELSPSSRSAAAALPRVHLSRRDGGDLGDCGVAWVDGAGRAHEIELTAEGIALRPNTSKDARFFAWAPGCAEAFVQGGDMNEDVVLTLLPARILRGRVVEDGGPPSRSIYLWALGALSNSGLKSQEWALAESLEDLGAKGETPECWTRSDGSFALEGLPTERSGFVYLPSTNHPVVDGMPLKDSEVPFGADQEELLIETILLPSVRGRLVWEDDGTPVIGFLWVVYEKKETGSSSMTGARTDEQGNFALGMPIAARAMLMDPVERADGLLHRAVKFRIDDANGTSLSFEQRVETATKLFPIDLGVLRVPRALLHSVRVVGPGGDPIQGAAVASRLDKKRTDAEGRARLHCSVDDELQVLAVGFAWASFAVDLGAEQDLRLAPGSTLAVHMILPESGTEDRQQQLPVQLVWEQSPFEGAHIAGSPPYSPMPDRVHRVFHGSSGFIGGWSHASPGAPGQMSFSLPETGDLFIPGLRAGSAFRVQVVDSLAQPLLEVPVTMPDSPMIHRIELTGGVPACSLRARLVDTEGNPLGDGSVGIRSPVSGRGQSFEVRSGELATSPLAAGSYGLRVQMKGMLTVEIPEFVLDAETPVLELELLPARRLELTFSDASGRAIAIQSVRLTGPDDWTTMNRDLSFGHVLIRAAPLGELRAEIKVGTRTFLKPIEAEVEVAALILPAHGGLEVHIKEPPSLINENGHLRLRARELDSDKVAEFTLYYSEGASGDLQIATELLPGEYELELDLVERVENAQEGDEPLVRSLTRRQVTIVPGEVRRIDADG